MDEHSEPQRDVHKMGHEYEKMMSMLFQILCSKISLCTILLVQVCEIYITVKNDSSDISQFELSLRYA